MSGIGICVRMKTSDLDRCLALAARVTPGNGRDAFTREWAAATLDEDVLEGSGFLLSSYFLAQSVLNGLPDPFDAPQGSTLAKIFTAAFPVRAPLALPPFEPKALADFCIAEWRDDGPAVCDGLAKADAFLKAGIARIDDTTSVVFIIA